MSPKEVESFPDERLVMLTTGSQGEPLSALRRMAHQEHPQVKLHSGDTIIFSATPIPGNERAVNETVDRLYQIGATVITTQDAAVHASGHGWSEEIKLMLNLTKPRYVMPIHGDHKRLHLHGKLAEAVGVAPGRDLQGAQRPAARDRRARRALRRAGAAAASCSSTGSTSGTSRTSRCATAARCRRTGSSSWSRPCPARTAGRSRRPRSSPAACRS